MIKSNANNEYHYLYNDKRWRGVNGLQKRKLLTDPNCWYCEQANRIVRATVVDHIKPHRGNHALFFNWDNLRSSCKPCHDSVAQLKDIHGYAPGVDVDGLPLDDDHPWR